MEKDCTITSSSPYSFPAGFGADALQQEHYRSPTNVRTLTPNGNDQRQGIIMAMVSCLLLFLTAYGILGLVQQTGTCRGEAPPSCCRKTVLSLKSPTGAFIVPLRSTNANLYIKENIDETVFMFALFKCRKSDKGRN